MQTSFTPEQLADPHVAESEKILRKCVHCGICACARAAPAKPAAAGSTAIASDMRGKTTPVSNVFFFSIGASSSANRYTSLMSRHVLIRLRVQALVNALHRLRFP